MKTKRPLDWWRGTDDNGEAHFDVDPGTGEVYVDGDTKYRGRIAGRVVVYI